MEREGRRGVNSEGVGGGGCVETARWSSPRVDPDGRSAVRAGPERSGSARGAGRSWSVSAAGAGGARAARGRGGASAARYAPPHRSPPTKQHNTCYTSLNLKCAFL